MSFFKKIPQKVQQIVSAGVNSFFERRLRRQLKNDNFSIICSNCIGGVIYHRLGKQFLSPTVNMWMRQREFLTFVENLREACSQDVVFIPSEYDYPVGKITTKGGDVRLYFNHAATQEEALENWNRRRERINYDNLFLIMYDREDIAEEDLRRLERIPCKNKAVLSQRSFPELPYVITMKGTDRPNGQQCLDKDWFGRRTFEKHFNFVKWLNV